MISQLNPPGSDRSIRTHPAAAWFLVAAGIVAIPLTASAGPDAATPANASPNPIPVYAPRENQLLVGLYIRGREEGSITAVRNGEFFLPLEELAVLTAMTITEDAEIIYLETPIGRVPLDADDTRLIDGIRYIAQSAIEDKLASPVRFDPEEFALDIDLAWTSGLRSPHGKPTTELEPEVRPPGFSLSTLRVDTQYLDSDLQGTNYSLNSLFAGRADGGRWQVRLATDFRGNTRWNDYAWLQAHQGKLLLIGHQRVQLHPVLPGLEVTGVQVAFTNHSLSQFSRTFEPGVLLPRRLRPISNFAGSGPAAGIAELRVDGSIVARQSIGLNGLWDFYEVPVPSFQYTRIEVWLYERHNTHVPVEILDQSRTMSSFLLPKGAWVHQGGGGYWGNLVEDLRENRERSDFAGFYQWRQGLNANLTVEAAIQHRPDRTQAMAGLVTRLRRDLLVSAAVASEGSAGGYHLELDWRRPQWYLRGMSRFEESGFLSELSPETSDHYLELGHSPWPTLDVALIARRLQRTSQEAEFILPAATWRPTPFLYMQARPDELGEYVFNLSYRVRDRARLSIYHQGRTFVDFSVWPSSRTSIFAGAEFGGELDESYSLLGQYSSRGRFRPTFLAGPLYSDGELGYQVKTSVAIAPGMLLRAEFADDPLRVPTQRRGRRFLIAINADLTWAHGKVMPAYTRGVREDRGGIAGIVRVEVDSTDDGYSLDDLTVLVAGRPVARTSRGGRFYAANLREGVYQVELDTENLPIELQPARRSVIAQIAGGAITRLEFTVRPEYGVAGRVTDLAGRHLAGVKLQLMTTKGAIAAHATTDRFGLYRVDQLPPATYELQLAPGQFPGKEASSRTISVTNDFLFAQDLELPFIIDSSS